MPHTNANRGRRHRTSVARTTALTTTLVLSVAMPVAAQNGNGNHTRLERFGVALVYGTLTGLAFAGIDQARNDPPEWGRGGEGYARRAGSNVGEFVIQEGVSEGLAAVMNRPVGYTRCKCTGNSPRIRHAVFGAVTDEMPNGSRKFAVPRVVGAYVGSFAQGAWRPNGGRNWLQLGLARGTASIALGAGINLFHEFVK
jgi:hypothetical protein